MALLAAGDVKSATVENGILELCQKLQAAEQALTVPQNRVQLTINTDTNIATIAVQLAVTPTVSSTDGSVRFTAVAYA